MGTVSEFDKVDVGVTAAEAVNNILYNVPYYKDPNKEHVLSVLVDNEVGILSKISGLLSARGFNIDSLSVSKTDVKELSRMTIKVVGQAPQIVQCRRQLEDLVNVWAVVDYTDVSHLDRELVLVKVSTAGRNAPINKAKLPMELKEGEE